MRRVYYALLILFVSSNALIAQSVNEIKESDEYLSGEGWGESLKAADNAALQDLISKISVSVESQFENIEEEMSDQNGIDSRSACRSVVNTYSQATLQNTQRIVIENEPDAHVFRYVKRSEVDKIFESRRLKVFDMVASAVRAVEKGKIDDALRYYYWSYCLLQSIPGANAVTDANGHVLTHWIPEQMNEVFGGVKAYKVSEQEGVAEIRVMYNGQPVTSMDYTYFDGMDWSSLYGAKDGRGFVELRPGMTTENLKIKCEYEYSGEAHIDKEISTVVNVMKGRVFRNAYVMVEGNAVGKTDKTLTVSSKQKTTTNDLQVVGQEEQAGKQSITLLSAEESDAYHKSIETVVAAVKLGAAVQHLDDAVDGAVQEIAVMGNGDHGAVELIEIFLQPLGGLQVQMVGGLIQQQDIRILQNEASQIHAGLFAAGEVVEEPCAHIGVNGEAVCHLVDSGVGIVAAQTFKAGRQLAVAAEDGLIALPCRHALGEGIHLFFEHMHAAKRRLQHVLHRVAHRVHRDLGDEAHAAARGDDHIALVIVQFAGEDAEQRCLACAVFTQQTHPLTGIDLEGQSVQYFLFQVEGLDQSRYADVDH